MSFNFMYSDLDLERIGQAKEEEMSVVFLSDARNVYTAQLDAVVANAVKHADKIPTYDMLLEEVVELKFALDDHHRHEPAHELIQIGGIVLNWLKQLDEAG